MTDVLYDETVFLLRILQSEFLLVSVGTERPYYTRTGFETGGSLLVSPLEVRSIVTDLHPVFIYFYLRDLTLLSNV